MKKIALFVLLSISLSGCSVDNGNQDSYLYDVIPVDSYTLPDKFVIGNTYEIKLKYTRPTACHFFQGIYYNKELNVRTIAIQIGAPSDQVCTLNIPPQSEASFNFVPTVTGLYIFKFYKGKDSAGKELFEEVEVNVIPKVIVN